MKGLQTTVNTTLDTRWTLLDASCGDLPGTRPCRRIDQAIDVTRRHSRRLRVVMLAGVAMLAFGSVAGADPPSRVARLGYTSGAVSFSPAGETDWVLATLNRPLTAGDRLWADAGARAELQIGGASLRISAGTSVSVLNLDDQIAQLQLAQGTLSVNVRRLDSRQVFEVDTPNLALTLRQPGEYRIEVDPDGNATTVVMRRGRGEVYGEGIDR